MVKIHNIHKLLNRRKELRKNQTPLIEVDGEIHLTKEAREYDTVRDKYCRELNYKVLRFGNDEIEKNVEKVVEKIKSCFAK